MIRGYFRLTKWNPRPPQECGWTAPVGCGRTNDRKCHVLRFRSIAANAHYEGNKPRSWGSCKRDPPGRQRGLPETGPEWRIIRQRCEVPSPPSHLTVLIYRYRESLFRHRGVTRQRSTQNHPRNRTIMPPTIAYPRANPKLSPWFYLTTERRYTENIAET